jgi:hypothetical protein
MGVVIQEETDAAEKTYAVKEWSDHDSNLGPQDVPSARTYQRGQSDSL